MTRKDYIMRLEQLADHLAECEEQSRFYWELAQDLLANLKKEEDG